MKCHTEISVRNILQETFLRKLTKDKIYDTAAGATFKNVKELVFFVNRLQIYSSKNLRSQQIYSKSIHIHCDFVPPGPRNYVTF